jgi:hypothetical protein
VINSRFRGMVRGIEVLGSTKGSKAGQRFLPTQSEKFIRRSNPGLIWDALDPLLGRHGSHIFLVKLNDHGFSFSQDRHGLDSFEALGQEGFCH